MTTILLELANDLEKIKASELEAEQFRKKYSNTNKSSTLYKIICNVDHYLTDNDIRIKDKNYENMQNTELSKLIYLLKIDGDINKILSINFIESTNL